MDREHRRRRWNGCPVRPQPGERPLEDVGARALDRRVQFFREPADPMPRPSGQGGGRDLPLALRAMPGSQTGIGLEEALPKLRRLGLAQRHAVVVLGVVPQPLAPIP